MGSFLLHNFSYKEEIIMMNHQMFMNPQMQNNPYYSRINPQPTQNSINWVQGIEGAKAFQLMPNSNAVMLDSENDGIFYIKISDDVGMCTLRTFKFEEITNRQNQKINPDEYVKKSELEALVNQMLGGNNDKPVSTAKSSKNTITE